MESENLYKIGYLTETLGITHRTVRYYDQEGLLVSVIRTPGGMRLFTDKDIERIKRIKMMQQEKLSLEEIKEQLEKESSKYIDESENIAIVTDSAASLPQKIIDEYDIFVVPLNITIQDKTYKDGVELSPIDFFQKVNGQNFRAKTTSADIDDITNLYKDLVDKGYTKIIAIHITKQFNSTIEIAQKAKESISDIDIEIIDSKNTGLGLGIQVFEAAKLAKEKKKFKFIVKEVTQKAKRCWQYVYLDSMDYFLQGIDSKSVQQNVLSAVLNYRPVLLFNPDFGQFTTIDRVKNPEEAARLIVKALKEYEKEYGKSFRTIGISHSHLYNESYDFMKKIKKEYPHVNVIISESSSVLNSFVGFYSMSLSIC